MRKISSARLIIVTVLLAVTALSVNVRGERTVATSAKRPLQQAFAQFGSWRSWKDIAMESKVEEALHLDDYLFRAYQRDKDEVTLYIGYYRTAGKVGAAHDPLVCFQGQGWKIVNRDSGKHQLVGRPGLAISYSTMVAEREGERELILYWFQANRKATSSTHLQKVAMVLEKISGNGEDNAFVRLSAHIGSGTPEAARQRIFDFIDGFYPQFANYVTQG